MPNLHGMTIGFHSARKIDNRTTREFGLRRAWKSEVSRDVTDEIGSRMLTPHGCSTMQPRDRQSAGKSLPRYLPYQALSLPISSPGAHIVGAVSHLAEDPSLHRVLGRCCRLPLPRRHADAVAAIVALGHSLSGVLETLVFP